MATAPLRTCIGCRRRRSWDELVRYVRLPDATVRPGPRLEGRGAWLCAGSASCLTEAVKRKAFARAFRAPVVHEGSTLLDEAGGGSRS